MPTPEETEPRLRWTQLENQKLLECIQSIYHAQIRECIQSGNHKQIHWPGIAELAGMPYRTDKSCWERYYNQLRPDINKARFSEEEDKAVLLLQSLYGNRWAFIRDNYLQDRTANYIKNRYNTLKKKLATSTHQNIPSAGSSSSSSSSSSSILSISTLQEIPNSEAYPAEFPSGNEVILEHESSMTRDVINSNETNFNGDYSANCNSGLDLASMENLMPTEEVIKFFE